MPDITAELLPALQAYRLPGLSLGEGFIHPQYNGWSILNLPATVCRLLGVPELGAALLAPEILARLETGPGEFRRVILILMDALGLRRMQRWMSGGPASVWGALVERGLLAPLTSAAITSLWTGRSPSEHGITGYEMWLKEYGLVANTVLNTPAAFRSDPDSLRRAGLTPEKFQPFLNLGEHLAAHGVQTDNFMYSAFLRSGLSQMCFRGTRPQGFSTAADLWVNARSLLENRSARALRQFVYIYWSEVDTLSHRYGPDDERTEAEFAAFSAAFQRLFLERLSPEARQDTLLILTADHGAVSTTPDPYYDLRGHPNLLRRLHLLPTGEHRLAYLYIRPGQVEAVREYVERAWPNGFSQLDPAYAVAAGLFGPGQPHPGLQDRVGDLILAARGSAYWWWADRENEMYGRHGGLSEEEMLVPFLAARLADL